MALDSLSDYGADTYIGGAFYLMWWLAGDGNMKCGYTITDHATNDTEVIIGTLNTACYGITALQSDVDIDTAITDGTICSNYVFHIGTALRVIHEDDAEATLKGAAFVPSIDGDAGTVQAGTTAGRVVGYALKTYDVTAGDFIELIT